MRSNGLNGPGVREGPARGNPSRREARRTPPDAGPGTWVPGGLLCGRAHGWDNDQRPRRIQHRGRPSGRLHVRVHQPTPHFTAAGASFLVSRALRKCGGGRGRTWCAARDGVALAGRDIGGAFPYPGVVRRCIRPGREALLARFRRRHFPVCRRREAPTVGARAQRTAMRPQATLSHPGDMWTLSLSKARRWRLNGDGESGGRPSLSVTRDCRSTSSGRRHCVRGTPWTAG